MSLRYAWVGRGTGSDGGFCPACGGSAPTLQDGYYYSEGVFHIPRQDAETIAESAAFVVGAHFGFDTGVRSFPYVALWAKDKKVLENNLGAIRRVAGTILEELEKAN